MAKRPMIKIYDADGEFELREMNDEELAQYEADRAATAALIAAEEEKAAQKAAILEKLGISEDELRIALG